MEKNQEMAWDCLTSQEQNSLLLTLSQGLSTWQASEALGMTHYKYLELKSRSETFFKMFSDYFYKHPSLIPPRAPLSDPFKYYLEGTILKRKSKNDALVYAGDSKWYLREIKSKSIELNMNKLRETNDEWCKDLYSLVMEFDRWNNFRILPPSLQAPSAYKRRSIKKYKIYLRFLYSIPDFRIKSLIHKYYNPGRKRWYIALISTMFKEGYKLIPVAAKKQNFKDLTNSKIYLFETKEEAESFALYASRFFIYTSDIKAGQNYWPGFQSTIEVALNYKEINHLDFTSYSLGDALSLKKRSIPEITRLLREEENTSNA